MTSKRKHYWQMLLSAMNQAKTEPLSTVGAYVQLVTLILDNYGGEISAERSKQFLDELKTVLVTQTPSPEKLESLSFKLREAVVNKKLDSSKLDELLRRLRDNDLTSKG